MMSVRYIFSSLLIVFTMSTYSNGIKAQVKLSLQDSSYLVNTINKNLMIYTIINNHIRGSYRITEGYFDDNDFTNSFTLRQILDMGCYYNVSLKRSNLEFPFPEYDLYEFYYPYSNILCSDTSKYSITTYDQLPFKNNRYLIGFNHRTRDLLFISGDFILNSISVFFNLTKENADMFIPYLNLKLFNLKVHKIQFLKSEYNRVYFKGFSPFYENGEKEVFFYLCINTSLCYPNNKLPMFEKIIFESPIYFNYR